MYKLDQHLFIYHFWQTFNFESTYRKLLFIKVAIFSDVILVSNYHNCKEEVTNQPNTALFDIVYKVVKSSHLEKWQSFQMEVN